GGATLRLREVVAGGAPRWVAAMGVVPGLAVLPHFDRMSGFVGADVFQRIIATAPAGVTLVGVDEDTALIHDRTEWRVSGRQSVVVYGVDGQKTVYQHGEAVVLP
ncbi:MAG: hypothetical protein H7Z42_09230, partial [Roseiflexaceae bacterium]|nr:hypothetical protein [Roseiflexaceae bacterium]